MWVMSSSFDESSHPRAITGKFAAKRGDAPSGKLGVATVHGRAMNPQRVTIDGLITADAADVAPEIRWNGFAVPLFDRENTDRIVEWANSADDGEPKPAFEWVDGKLYDFWYGDDEVERTEVSPVFDSNGVPLYGVGAFSWVWSEAPDELS